MLLKNYIHCFLVIWDGEIGKKRFTHKPVAVKTLWECLGNFSQLFYWLKMIPTDQKSIGAITRGKSIDLERHMTVPDIRLVLTVGFYP